MIDPLLALSLSIEGNLGVYALLLGSGISRAAGIPTGWEVVLDLIRKLACAEKQSCEPDPAGWLKTKHDMDPDYSKLLDSLGRTPAERRQLLSSYFEPTTEEEREQNLKTPTKAHRAIADLVQGGYIKVILTTNFDRLMEHAIEDVGITPVIVSTAEACAGMLPLTHQKCVVVKLHGDYLDVRIKNTPDELASYDPAMNQLLDRILDDFGLIICGWSGEWDAALRAAIERCPTRRFTTFWAARGGAIGQCGSDLVKLRSGQVLDIADADSFFVRLSEQVKSLADSRAPHPLSVAAAVAAQKRFITEDRHRIRLRDLVTDEAQRTLRELHAYQDEWLGNRNKVDLATRMASQRDITKCLRHLIINGCYYGRTPEHTALWSSCIRLIAADPKRGKSGPILNDSLRLYPAIVLLYAGGVAALAAGHEDILARILRDVTMIDRDGKVVPLVKSFDWGEFYSVAQELCEQRMISPIGEHFHAVLMNDLGQIIIEPELFEHCFDGFEYRRSLCYADLRLSEKPGTRLWAPACRFMCKLRRPREEYAILDRYSEPILSQGESWPFLHEKWFDGSFSKAKEIIEKYNEFAPREMNLG